MAGMRIFSSGGYPEATLLALTSLFQAKHYFPFSSIPSYQSVTGNKVIIVSDSSLIIKGAQPLSHSGSNCLPFFDPKSAVNAWQCSGVQSGVTVFQVSAKEPLEFEMARGQTVILQPQPPLPSMYASHEGNGLIGYFSAQKQNEDDIKQVAKQREELLRLKVIKEDDGEDRYILLQRLDGIKPEERKTIEKQFQTKEEQADNDSGELMGLAQIQYSELDEEVILIPENKALCITRHQEICQSFVQSKGETQKSEKDNTQEESSKSGDASVNRISTQQPFELRNRKKNSVKWALTEDQWRDRAVKLLKESGINDNTINELNRFNLLSIDVLKLINPEGSSLLVERVKGLLSRLNTITMQESLTEQALGGLGYSEEAIRKLIDDRQINQKDREAFAKAFDTDKVGAIVGEVQNIVNRYNRYLESHNYRFPEELQNIRTLDEWRDVDNNMAEDLQGKQSIQDHGLGRFIEIMAAELADRSFRQQVQHVIWETDDTIDIEYRINSALHQHDRHYDQLTGESTGMNLMSAVKKEINRQAEKLISEKMKKKHYIDSGKETWCEYLMRIFFGIGEP